MSLNNMTTTFVLHGGMTSIDSVDNDLFFRQITETVEKNEVSTLLCYWARPKDEWDELFASDTAKITRLTSKRISYTMAMDVDDLYLKLATADILYVRGGEPELIEPFLPQLSELKNKLNGKVYLGSSMGAFIVSKHFVLSIRKQDDSTVHQGLGILPISTLCHWNVEKKKQFKIDILQKEDPTLPIVLLDEQKCVKFVY